MRRVVLVLFWGCVLGNVWYYRVNENGSVFGG